MDFDKSLLVCVLCVAVACKFCTGQNASVAPNSPETRISRQINCPYFSVRLERSSYSYSLEMRLEICNRGRWYSICSNQLHRNDFNVILRQLDIAEGYTPISRNIRNQRRDTLQITFTCRGTEFHLGECGYHPTYCGFFLWFCHCPYVAGVVCIWNSARSGPKVCPDGALQLTGSSQLEGRLEFCNNGMWGTVCADDFTELDANVACRQLHYSPTGATLLKEVTAGSGPISICGISCSGSESQLLDCQHYPLGQYYCDRRHDVGVRCLAVTQKPACTHASVRLVGEVSDFEGRVEICINGIWGTVCGYYFNVLDASVVCQQLGHYSTGATPIFKVTGTGYINLDIPNCVGNESRLIDCSHLPSRRYYCDHAEDVGVRCIANTTEITPEPDCTEHGKIELRDDSESIFSRVEVCYHNRWGSVCNSEWNNADAQVVCRQLGLYAASTGAISFIHGNTGLLIWLDKVACEGNESRLENCRSSEPGIHKGYCVYFAVAGVVCVPINEVKFAVVPSTIVEGEDAQFTLSLARASITSVTVLFSTVDGTAYAPGDYTATSRNVTFEPRVLVQIISVRTERNTKVHGSKIFRASLSNPSAGLSIVEQNVSEVTMLDHVYKKSFTEIGTGIAAALGALVVVLAVAIVVVSVLLVRSCKEEYLKRKEDGYESWLTRYKRESMYKQHLSKRCIIKARNLKFTETVGQGQYGTVHKGKMSTRAYKGAVALKTLKGFSDPNLVEDMLEDCSRMSDFDHPNILTIIGVCVDGDRFPFIIIPFVFNGSLLSYLRKERNNLCIPPMKNITDEVSMNIEQNLLNICYQVAKGMEYLAQNFIQHRNLGARNCMIHLNCVKVCDYGLSAIINPCKVYFRREEKSVDLPVKWMSPESLQDGVFSEKADVWSYGVTCWEVFSGGKIPYHGIKSTSVPSLLAYGIRLKKPSNAACSDTIFENVVANCWMNKPANRPSFGALVYIISRYIKVGDLSVISGTATGIAASNKQKLK